MCPCIQWECLRKSEEVQLPGQRRSAGLCWLRRSRQCWSISWCKALEPWSLAEHAGTGIHRVWVAMAAVWVSLVDTCPVQTGLSIL